MVYRNAHAYNDIEDVNNQMVRQSWYKILVHTLSKDPRHLVLIF